MWIRRLILVSVLFGWILSPLPAAAQDGAAAALAWLRTEQLADGGFSTGFSEGSDPGATADAVVAIASAGEDPSTWVVEGTSPIQYLTAQATKLETPGLAAKVVLAAVAAGEDPRDFGGANLVDAVLAGFNSETGLFGGGPYDSGLSVLALRAAGEALPEGALTGLVATRLPDGSYSFAGDMTPDAGDSNTTALVVQALLAAGAGSEAAPSIDYFRLVQNADGGWTYQKPSAFGEDTDANSTAVVIQALMASGQDLSEWGHPERALQALQQPSGALAFNAATPGDNFLATVQAIPALAGADLTDVPRLPAGFAATGGSTTPILMATLVVLLAVLAAAGLLGRSRRAEG
ncbi:MAG TPA: hypothetical protein VFI11_12210 [Anaerolineales bacterium]|nr:hypothetical protein [Anaerolineales bacterium]